MPKPSAVEPVAGNAAQGTPTDFAVREVCLTDENRGEESELAASGGKLPTQSAEDCTNARILIIDDEEANLLLLERILISASFENLVTTPDPREAVGLFRGFQPDLVLTDWCMPHLDGSSVIKALRGLCANDDYLPIVVLTADVNPATKQRALAIGATDFLTKPLDRIEVLLRIQNLLNTRFCHLKIQEQNVHLEEKVRERTIELEQALDELKATQKQVIQQERLAALGTMAGGIAHDFNNALSIITGFGELMLRDSEGGLTKEAAEFPLKTILTAADDGAKTVHRLREFYRPSDDDEEVCLPVNLNTLIEQSISLTKPKWETKPMAAGYSVEVHAHLGDIPFVKGNAAELREVLTNLIFNAVDAMPAGGTITIETEASEESVIARITDTGTGMTDEVRERCLEPFFTTKAKNGTGLGLAMVFGIVQRHSGRLEIESEVGKGTTFIVRLPAEYRPMEAVAGPSISFERPLHILVVDDQPILCDLLREYLQNDCHTVETAQSAHEALGKFGAADFDVVITDQAMPEMNGRQLALQLKAMKPAQTVILLTGYREPLDQGDESAIDLVLSKPFSCETLRHALARTMSGSRNGVRS